MSPVHTGKNDLGQYVAIVLDKAIYNDRAIMKTCYMLTDGYYIHITSSSPEQYIVHFYSKLDLPDNEKMDVFPIKQFLEELNDNQLRQILLAETQAVHEEIVRKAFAPVTELVSRECREDKLNILISAV